jgi:hypothetical protein
MSINDGGPAFPIPPVDVDGWRNGWYGASLRDYFAAKAMQAAVHNFEHGELWEGMEFNGKDAAQFAYAMADAMLAEREKP